LRCSAGELDYFDARSDVADGAGEAAHSKLPCYAENWGVQHEPKAPSTASALDLPACDACRPAVSVQGCSPLQDGLDGWRLLVVAASSADCNRCANRLATRRPHAWGVPTAPGQRRVSAEPGRRAAQERAGCHTVALSQGDRVGAPVRPAMCCYKARVDLEPAARPAACCARLRWQGRLVDALIVQQHALLLLAAVQPKTMARCHGLKSARPQQKVCLLIFLSHRSTHQAAGPVVHARLSLPALHAGPRRAAAQAGCLAELAGEYRGAGQAGACHRGAAGTRHSHAWLVTTAHRTTCKLCQSM